MKLDKLDRIFPVRNRWLCLVMYMLAIFFTSCTYYGWQHMQWVLVLSDKFIDKCPEGAVRPIGAAADDYLCDAQAAAIDNAYTIASSCEFSGGLLAGVLYDNVGPALTALFGEVLHFISWPLILYSNSSSLTYFGFAMIGLSVNCVAIPAMVLMLRFLRYPLLTESLNLSMQTITAFIMPTFYMLMTSNPWTFTDIMNVYLPIAAIVAVIYIGLLPARQCLITKELAAEKEYITKPLTHYLTRPVYIVFVLWYSLCIMQMSMFNVKLDTLAPKAVSEYVGWIFVAQAPIGICFGLLNEKIKTLRICWLLTIMTILSYIFAIVNTVMESNSDTPEEVSPACYYIGATLYVVANSYIYTCKYTWITELFPEKYFGTLTGVVGLAAGVIQTINTAMVQYDAMTMLVTYCSLGVLQLGFLAYIQWQTSTTNGKGLSYSPMEVMKIASLKEEKDVTSSYSYEYY